MFLVFVSSKNSRGLENDAVDIELSYVYKTYEKAGIHYKKQNGSMFYLFEYRINNGSESELLYDKTISEYFGTQSRYYDLGDLVWRITNKLHGLDKDETNGEPKIETIPAKPITSYPKVGQTPISRESDEKKSLDKKPSDSEKLETPKNSPIIPTSPTFIEQKKLKKAAILKLISNSLFVISGVFALIGLIIFLANLWDLDIFRFREWWLMLPFGISFISIVVSSILRRVSIHLHPLNKNLLKTIFRVVCSLVLGITSLLFSIQSVALYFEQDLSEGQVVHYYSSGWYYDLTDDSSAVVLVKPRKRLITSVNIPTKLGGKDVVGIGDSAFFCCRSLTSIEIPSSVTSIGEGAFAYCNSLTSIEIPNSVTSIGDSAFCGCDSLTSVTIPNSVTSIGNWAFCDCSSLTSVTIPSSVTSIGGLAFGYCSSLTSIEIPSSVTSIASSAFSGCDLLKYNEYDNAYYLGNETNPYLVLVKAKLSSITSCEINSNTKIIAGGAFRDCSSLTSVTIPNSVTSIASSAFSGCDLLKYNEYDNAYYLGNETNPYLVLVKAKLSSITSCEINSNTKIIAGGAFRDCSSLTSVTIPNSVTSIGDSAFEWCSSLTTITIPDSVTSIGNWAFCDCSLLTSVTIPNSVTSIGEEAFYSCNLLTSIRFNGTVDEWKEIVKSEPIFLSASVSRIICDNGFIFL